MTQLGTREGWKVFPTGPVVQEEVESQEEGEENISRKMDPEPPAAVLELLIEGRSKVEVGDEGREHDDKDGSGSSSVVLLPEPHQNKAHDKEGQE